MRITDDELALQRIYRWERERAGQIFLTQPCGTGRIRDWTWARATGESRRMAAYLKAQNWEPGSKVAILSRNCAWWLMADMAIWMAGHVSVPIYPSLKAQTVRQIVEHSEARACFVGATEESETPAEGIPPSVMRIRFPTAVESDSPSWEDIVRFQAPMEENPVRPGDDLATIIYTSGTTGVPKGVMHNFSAFTFLARTLSKMYGFTSELRMLSYLPMAHIVERGAVEGPAFYLGSRLFFTEGLQTFFDDLRRARPTVFLSVPRLLLKFQQGVFAKIPKPKLDRLLQIPAVNIYVKRRILRQLGLNTVQRAACGAAPLPTEIMLWYRNLGLDLAEGYGMTETMITHLPQPGTVRPGYVGAAVEGVESRVGENNELLVKSPMNMIGYYKDQQATRASFTEDGFFRTGDMVNVDTDGQVKIVGRVKEQFKTSKGKYVAPAPIESKLITHPDVEACCLMGTGHPSPFAVVVLSEAARQRCAEATSRIEMEQSLQSQLEEVNAGLDPHERVALLVIVEGPWTVGNGLMTPTLKLRRGALEHLYQPYLNAWIAERKPVVWENAPR